MLKQMVVGMVSLGLWGASAYAVDVPAMSPSKDASIYANANNFDTSDAPGSTVGASGKGPGLVVGADNNLFVKRSLIQFDLSGIPSNATITSVNLTLYLGQIGGSGQGGGGPTARPIDLFRVLQSWTEGNSGTGVSTLNMSGQGYTRSAGDVTWDNATYDPTTPTRWNNGTANVPGGYIAAGASATAPFSTFTVGSSYSWNSPGMIADVQNWVSDPTANKGWLLRSELETSQQSILTFWSKEGADISAVAGSERPALTISYTVPEPASLAIVAAAGAICVGSRRRQSAI